MIWKKKQKKIEVETNEFEFPEPEATKWALVKIGGVTLGESYTCRVCGWPIITLEYNHPECGKEEYTYCSSIRCSKHLGERTGEDKPAWTRGGNFVYVAKENRKEKADGQMYKPTYGEIKDLTSDKGRSVKDWDLSYLDLRGTDLREVDFSGANLAYVNLSNAILRGAKFKGANLSHANLCGADLSHTSLASANLSYANLAGANLPDVDFLGAIVDYANFQDANLQHSSLFWSSRESVNLEGAHLQGAEF